MNFFSVGYATCEVDVVIILKTEVDDYCINIAFGSEWCIESGLIISRTVD